MIVPSRPRILVTRPLLGDALDILREAGEVEVLGEAEGDDVLQARISRCDALVCQLTDGVDASLLAAAPGLRVISTVSVGWDHIDVAAAAARGIAVTHTPGVLTEATADLAFALLLAAARRIPEADRYVREGRWSQWRLDLLLGADLCGRTLGVIGAGRIGCAVLRRARGFGMTLLAAGRGSPPASLRELGATWVSFEELLERAHFVSLHLPGTAETHHLIDAAALARMRPDAILVNTARGSVVDEAALADALEGGRLAGCGLDVFEDEPRVHARILAHPRVVLAPHIGSASRATRTRMCTLAAEQTVAVLHGVAPAHPVPAPEAGGL